jgi:hypothetical protein
MVVTWFRGGHVEAVERIDDGAEADERVLAHLARLGCDETTPCFSTHFLYLPEATGADAIATALREDGWVASVGEAGDDTWLVVAAYLSALDTSRVRRTRKRLEALAAEHGGVYDGWQTTAA